MAINRAAISKELLPGLNAVFGMEYGEVNNEHEPLYEVENSDRSFEEEVLFTGFGTAPTKQEGAAVQFDTAQESFTARYSHETVALAFSLTEEAVEDNLYDTLSARYTKSLARSMAYTKQVKAANVLNNAFTAGATAGGDGVALLATNHPLTNGGTFANEPSVAAYLNETSLEDAEELLHKHRIEKLLVVDDSGESIATEPSEFEPESDGDVFIAYCKFC